MNVAKIIILSCIQDKNKGYFVSCVYSDRNLLFIAITEYDLCPCIRYHGVKYNTAAKLDTRILLK